MNKQNYIIGIVGLGYVGLSLAYLSQKKFTTYAFDIDKTKIAKLKKISYISDLDFNKINFDLKKNFLTLET